MTRKLVIGVDPGAITGIAGWDADGYSFSFQDEERVALRMAMGIVKEHKQSIVDVVIESAWMGKGPAASLSVAERVGGAKIFFWMMGITKPTWNPRPSEWRSRVGFDMRVPAESGKTRPADRDALEAQARKMAGDIVGRRFTKETTHEAEAICIARAGYVRLLSRL